MRPEDFEQIYLIDWAFCQKDVHPYLLHVRNEGKRTLWEGAKAKRMGLKKGVSDLFFAKPVPPYHGFWIELKSKKGRPTREQLNFLELMESVGYYVGIYYSWQEAPKAINLYLGKNFPL